MKLKLKFILIVFFFMYMDMLIFVSDIYVLKMKLTLFTDKSKGMDI